LKHNKGNDQHKKQGWTMQDDYKPILFNTPKEYDFIRLYFLHDIHKGSELHDGKKFDAVKKLIVEDERAYCIVVGDTIENAIPNSKSDVFYQTLPPHEQKECGIKSEGFHVPTRR